MSPKKGSHHKNPRKRKGPLLLSDEWLLERSTPEPNTGCWLWLLAVGSNGYARYSPTNTRRGVTLTNDLLLAGPGLYALHKCDQRSCVNPDHIYAGTHAENMRDRNSRGRQNNGRMRKPALPKALL